jgi:hypothetical protein
VPQFRHGRGCRGAPERECALASCSLTKLFGGLRFRGSRP